MPKRFWKYSRTEPARTIVAVVAVLTFLGALWLLTPWSIPTVATPAVAMGFDIPRQAGAVVNALVCLVPLWAVRKGTPEALSRGSSWLFSWFLFVSLTRVALMPIGSTAFLLPLMIALVMAVIHIEQHYLVRKSAGEDI